MVGLSENKKARTVPRFVEGGGRTVDVRERLHRDSGAESSRCHNRHAFLALVD
jgi:hypothetical protein